MYRKIGYLVMFFVLFTVYIFEIQAKPLLEDKMPEELKKKFLDAGANTIDLKLAEAVYQLNVNGVRNALASGIDHNNSFNIIDISSSSMVELAILQTNLSFYRREEAKKCCVDILSLLFDVGGKPGEESLYHAIALKSPAMVQLLLDNGADPNNEINGLTPVELAEKLGENEIVDIILKYGGRPISAKEATQLRFLHSVPKHNIVEMEKFLNNGAQINESYKGGSTALYRAMETGGSSREYQRYATVAYLLQKGANPNSQGKFGTALHNAVLMTSISLDVSKNGEPQTIYAKLVIEALLKAGADVSSHDIEGQTPLHMASKFNNLVGAEMLIEAGAKLMDRDKDGRTPLDYAESPEMIKLLKSHGAKEL